MKIINSVIALAFLGIFSSCSNTDKDDEYFNGTIRYFDADQVAVTNIQSKPVSLKDFSTGMIAAYDSLLIFWYFDFPNHFFDVFHVDTGEKLGEFFSKGRAANESTSVNPVFQFFKKNDDLMTLHYGSEGNMFFWNISQSLKKGTTVYDTIVPYENDRIFFQFYKSEDELFAYKPADYVTNHETTTPFYQKRTIYTNELIEEYPIYKIKSLENNKTEFSLSSAFYTWDVMKPDGSKIVQVMHCLPQINIIDTETGAVAGYRMEGAPDFSFLETDMNSMNRYYNCVTADDDYIYATYWGKPEWDDRPGASSRPMFNTIHIFDWDGKLLYNLQTDQSFFRVWVDPVRKRLYTINMSTDEVYYLDLTELPI